MDRWACVDVPALPLQLLLRRHPDWARQPVAVVDEDRPQGKILWVNERAHQSRIWPGRRYAEGLALCRDLRAGVVRTAEIDAAVAKLLQHLRKFSPEVEPGAHEPGLCWLNATGVEGLYPSLQKWGEELLATLRNSMGLAAMMAVGFTRFGTLALARADGVHGRVKVAATPQQERDRADRVPLRRLQIEPGLRDSLSALGIADVGAFRRLPPGGLLERFGQEAYRLHRLAHGERSDPLVPETVEDPVCETHEFEPDQHQIDVHGLLFLCKQRLAHVVQALGAQDRRITALRLVLLFDRIEPRDERIAPAEPTLDEVQLTDLLRLRLESIRLDDELTGFELHAEAVAGTSAEQKSLFRARPRRDLAAANRALARLRAELGETAIVAAHLQPGHLPEARFVWQPLPNLAAPSPSPSGELRLVRRVLAQPRVLLAQQGVADGWFVRGLGAGPLHNLYGPYVVSGGWWRREQHREYYFAETRRGDVLWIYRDLGRRRWVLHGAVE